MKWLVAIAVLAGAPVAAKGPVPASALLIREATPVLGWRWRAAPEVATQPGLLAALRTAGLRDLARSKAAAARDAALSSKEGIPFRRYETIHDWSLAADTPRLLAVASEIYSFTGGAHGNTGYAARIWDKAAKRVVTFDALFSDWPRARKLLEPAFCKALAEEQQRRRRNGTIGGDFDACPKLAEQPVVPWAGLAAQATQFRVLLGPYVAGPYAEGSYLVTVPWPEAVRTLVKPVYRVDLFGRAE